MDLNNATYPALKSTQKETIGLLCLGTFLEYFDMFLYLHMAVVLDELFFPKVDPHNKAILSALFFCSTFLIRPISALIFGYIGDNFGRKITVVITTALMAISCVVIATLPPYDKIGITATYIIICCRALQGIASMVEVVGADLYVTEITKPPVQYPAVMSIAISGVLGGTVALAVGAYVTAFNLDWRTTFWFGATVAGAGILARTYLRESQDFVDAKKRIKKALLKVGGNPSLLKDNPIWNQKVNKKTALAMFFLECGWPLSFYLGFVYFPDMLRNTYHLSAGQIIVQNLSVSIIQFFGWITIAYLSYRINPLAILKVRLFVFTFFILCCPFLVNNASSAWHILAIQAIVVTCGLMGMPANPIFYKYFPVFKRFTYITFLYALSRPVVYILTSMVMIYLYPVVKHWSIIIMSIPIILVFFNAVRYFTRLEARLQLPHLIEQTFFTMENKNYATRT